MKKYILFISLFTAAVFFVNGQINSVFNTVPVANGKVVFEHFVISEQGSTAEQNYAKVQKWVRDNYTGNPLLSSMRQDEKSQSVTVSSKANLDMPAGSDGMTMNYRLDISATSAGCMLIIRDVSFQTTSSESFFPKVYEAEQMITDQAVKAAGADNGLRNNTRKAALLFVNELYDDMSKQF